MTTVMVSDAVKPASISAGWVGPSHWFSSVRSNPAFSSSARNRVSESGSIAVAMPLLQLRTRTLEALATALGVRRAALEETNP